MNQRLKIILLGLIKIIIYKNIVQALYSFYTIRMSAFIFSRKYKVRQKNCVWLKSLHKTHIKTK